MPVKPEKFQPRNWRSATASQFRGMCAQQKARFLAYEEPPKEVQGVMAASRHRVCARLAELKSREREVNATQAAEKERRDIVMCQLKATEALNRVRRVRLRYQNMRVKEINLMIACQSTAQRAIHLELLLPVKETINSGRDNLGKLQRKRVEDLLDNTCGSLERC